jgi:hypothetical protein
MKHQTIIRKDVETKKVSVFANPMLSIIAAWLKPGDKLKYDDRDVKHYFLDPLGQIPYRKVYVNGQEGYVIASAIEEPKG